MFRVRDGWETSVRARAAHAAGRDRSLSPGADSCFMGFQLLARGGVGATAQVGGIGGSATGASSRCSSARRLSP